jgi:hypothetical protein
MTAPAKPARVATCHPERKHEARGLCKACYLRERRADLEVRERYNAAERERYAALLADPEYRERRNAAERERRADPEYRERCNAAQRERYADREYRERCNAAQRERRARQKKAQSQC